MKDRTVIVQSVFHVGLYYVMCFLLSQQANASSLMRRIRERQSTDETFDKGLDLESEDWVHVPQPVQDVLMSIDEKLRSLDTLSYTLKLARLDFSLDQLVRRMENIETKLGRLETKFDVRMEKVEEVVISKDIKEEFSNEHLSRRMEHLNEKINNKAAYLDAKLDIKLERIMSKLELLERDLHSSVDDILERLIKNDERYGVFEKEVVKKSEKFEELSGSIHELRIFLKEDVSNTLLTKSEDLKFQMDDFKTNFEFGTSKIVTTCNEVTKSVNDTILTSLRESNSKIDRLSTSCRSVDRLRSITEPCDDSKSRTTQELLMNLTSVMEKTLQLHEIKFQKLDSDVELYTRKVVNSIQELWKTSDQLKLDLSSALEQGNKTREMIRNEFRKLHAQVDPLSVVEPKLAHLSENLGKQMVELRATVDNSFATLLVAQNSFIASCRRIQDEEMHVYDILQQIVYEMRNRSSEDIYRINSELQLQWSRINRSLAHVTTAVWRAGNSTATSMRRLQLQLKLKDKCILKADDVNWQMMDSLCRQVSLEMPTTKEKLTDLIRNAVKFSDIQENVIETLSNDALRPGSEHLTEFDTKTVRNKSDNTSSHMDYEMDYPLSESDYNEPVND